EQMPEPLRNERSSTVPVAAVIATYKRPVELQRLLAGLAAGIRRPARVIIVDNAASPETIAMARSCGLNAEVIPLSSNPGPGAAWKCGMETAWQCEDIEWFWVMDDDVLIGPDVLMKLLATGRDADAVAPLLTDHDGNVWGFPEPVDPELRG